jgi:hypothetical protein
MAVRRAGRIFAISRGQHVAAVAFVEVAFLEVVEHEQAGVCPSGPWSRKRRRTDSATPGALSQAIPSSHSGVIPRRLVGIDGLRADGIAVDVDGAAGGGYRSGAEDRQ